MSPHGIEPTFLKLDSDCWWWVFPSYYILQCIILDQERKKACAKSFMHTKKIIAIFKNGFNPVLGSIPCLTVKMDL